MSSASLSTVTKAELASINLDLSIVDQDSFVLETVLPVAVGKDHGRKLSVLTVPVLVVNKNAGLS